MTDTAQARAQPSLRRDAILDAVAFAAERLLLTPDWRDAVAEVLGRLGRAAEVSRSYVVENQLDPDGRMLSVWVEEWTEPGVARVTDDPESRAAPWTESGFGRWAEALTRGEVVKGSIRDFPATERTALQRHGVRSLASFPIVVDGGWWGSVGFDDCHGERDWTGPEVDALRAAASLLGAAIHRQLTDRQAREAETRYRDVIDHIPAVTYTDLPGENGAVIGFISHQIEELLGYPPDRFQGDPDFWFSLIHPEDHDRIDEAARSAGRTQGRFDAEYRMRSAGGREVWVHDTSEPILDAAGAIRHWQGFLTDVTERRRAEDLVREAERRFRDLVEQLPAVLYIEEVSPGTAEAVRVSYMSPKAKDLLGYPPERWIETSDLYLELAHPDDVERAASAVERSNRDGTPLDLDYRMRHADGRWVWVHEEAVLIRDDKGGPRYWQGFMLDITERRDAEEALRAAEERYRALVERIPAVVYAEALDADVEQLYLSPQVEVIVGYTADQWKAAPGFWKSHIHPDDQPTVLRINAEANRSGEPYIAEYRFRRPDGSYVWLHDEAVRVFGEKGEPLFWQGVLLDITERKRAEEQLREAEERFRTIVEQSPAVIYTQEIDAETGLSETTYISPRNQELIGYSMEDIADDPGLWTELIHPDDRERVLAADRDTNRTGDTFSMEFRMIARDGRVIWVQDEATLVSVRGGRPYWQGFMVDISERKDAEEQLARALDVEREASRQLRALDEMKNTFLQAVSHDLRTPLAAILGLAVTLERSDVKLDPDDARDLARRIADNARKLERLVTNLLDMDRLARGIVTPKLHPTDVGGLVRRLLAESEIIGGARLHMDIQPVTIHVDTAKVERIVENLLANTARHTPSNAQIWVSVRPQDGGALILVEDDGPGVPAELRDTIFEPFQQGPEAPQHSPGVGVGLTLVKRFAELHEGRAWVEERLGGGASFRVLLPDGGKPSEDSPGPREREA
ncbi:MAG TPA: PAS domain-containing protein [Actinomycetota bacterium]|jgi:PAS domain S-box-containing protein|nr:PAS domain-containing protein [Actinomycetota bacterium]